MAGPSLRGRRRGYYALARIPVRLAVTQLRPLLWMLAIIAVFQVIVAGWERAW